MAIPLASLPQLRVGLRKRLSLYILFAVGSFAVIAAIIRAAVSIRDLHYPMTISRVLLWGIVEQTVASLVANAPGLRVLIFPGENFAAGSTSGRRATVGYARERSEHDAFEMRGTLFARAAVPNRGGKDGSVVPNNAEEISDGETAEKGMDDDISILGRAD
jgi:hypothetical protein